MTGNNQIGNQNLSLFQLREANTYDLESVDGKQYMMDHRLQGCFTLKAPVGLNPAYGCVEMDGIGPVMHFLTTIGGGPYLSHLLALKVQQLPLEYNQDYHVRLTGFVTEAGDTIPEESFTLHTLPQSVVDDSHPESNRVALQAAREAIVLLKNVNDILPCPHGTVLNLFGKAVHQFRVGTIGAGRITPRFVISLIRGLQDDSRLLPNQDLLRFYRTGTDTIPDAALTEKARSLSDYGVFIVSRGTSENFDNLAVPGEFYLSDEEERLARYVAETYPNSIAIINTGAPMDVSWVDRYGFKSALWTGLGGMFGGRALAEVLDGSISPSGRLPDTWSATYEELPASQNFYLPGKDDERLGGHSPTHINTVYAEDLYVGYRYYAAFSKQPVYPFGYGLSYTAFQCNVLRVQQIKASGYHDPIFQVEVEAKNTGYVSGQYVVQLYAGIRPSSMEEPPIRLAAFAKTKSLMPGESEKLSFQIEAERFAVYDDQKAAWVLAAGEYELMLSESALNGIVITSFRQEESLTLLETGNILKPPMDIPALTVTNPGMDLSQPMLTGEEKLCPRLKKEYHSETEPVSGTQGIQIQREQPILLHQVKTGEYTLAEFVTQMSDYELARFCVCAKTGWGMEENGEAGRLYRLEKYGMPELVFADGNNGVNIKTPNIGLPTSSGVAASFNEALAYEIGCVLAEEAKENGIHVILAPGANLHRNPLAGRNAEYFSEDPYLAGRMAGMHGKGLEDHGVLSCVKHFTANNCETARMHNQSIVSVRALRELYLKVFETIFSVYMPGTIMTSYNALNGEYTAANYEMIHDYIKGELGFHGMIMTDWGSSSVADPGDIIAAGNCWITPGGMDDREVNLILDAVRDGRVDRKTLERSVYNTINALLKMNIW